ncbi:hypothetical protein [Deinococcus sp.]|uniref:hypothetical protein n=1 Tax=Deinococcus sp. TaxID=47478 RepID=UPI003CC5BF4E
MPLEEQAARTTAALKIILRGAAGDGILNRLQAAMVAGHIDGRDLIRQATKSAMEMTLQAFSEDLRQLVGRVN